MAGRGRGRGKVGFIKPAEPSFIRKLKEQHGYKEGPSLEDKMRRDGLDGEVDGDEDREEEMPVVVVLKDGDLTKEEADRLQQAHKKDEEEAPPTDGRILFKKPVKKRDADDKNDCEAKPKKSKKEKKKEKQLLSFDDEEDN